MREDKYDIRAFNFTQLVTFIQIVSETHYQDLPVFRNYLDAAISQGLFSDTDCKNDFGNMIKLMHSYALNSCSNDDATTYQFLLLL